MGRPPEERRKVTSCACGIEELEAAEAKVAAQGRVIDDPRTIAQAWISDKPNDWGGDVRAECGRVVLSYLAAGGETETP